MEDRNQTSADSNDILSILKRLEARIARLEEHLGLEEEDTVTTGSIAEPSPTPGDEDEFELEIGQNWFAKIGIIVLAIGIAFILTFPYEGLPPAAPGLFGYVLVGGLFLLSHLWRRSFNLVSRYLFGGGLALLYFTTLRLYFFGPEPPLTTDAAGGVGLLTLVVFTIIVIAVRRKSPYLMSLSITAGYATALVVSSSWYLVMIVSLLSTLAVIVRLKYDAPGHLLFATCMSYLTLLLWGIGNPVLGHTVALAPHPIILTLFVILQSAILAVGMLLRPANDKENMATIMGTALNGSGSYGVFLLLTLAAVDRSFVTGHLIASGVLLLLAVAFWLKEQSRFSTFVYAMLGYMALSVAIIRASGPPEVFVWLSLQSILVVATAVWFRSRFIVVANFVIYLAIVTAYVASTTSITGIGLIFGVVALLSARILNWKQHRLELKTEMMRNAYLASAFLVFPYTLYHLVPKEYVSLSWVGVAMFYYLMNLLVQKQKYRWMGHLTLGLTVIYVLIIGIIQLEPAYRIISFLVLGIVLVAVSLIYTRLRGKRRGSDTGPDATPQQSEGTDARGDKSNEIHQ